MIQRRQALAAAAAAFTFGTTRGASANGPARSERLQVAGSQLELQFDESFSPALQALALQWVQRAADAVAGYLGRFPLQQVEVLLQAADGAGVQRGTAFPEPTPHLRIRLGRDSTARHFQDDWILVHEMLHLAVPQVPRSQNWLHEGIATYAEGVARVKSGWIPAQQLWGEFHQGMPKGQPQPGDRGLDFTPTWGRTYWGGALFCLQADVLILQRSRQRLGLRQALQGVLAAGGNYAVAWPVVRILAAADAAIGQTTLSDLHQQLRASSQPVDLVALWQDLGVEPAASAGAAVLLRHDAPAAAVRRAITA